MKALVKSRREPGIWMEDVPIPGVGHNDVLIKIRKTAICGTDVHIFNWDEWSQATIPVPMTMAMNLSERLSKLARRCVDSRLAIGSQEKDTSPVGIAETVGLAVATFAATPLVSVLTDPAVSPSIYRSPRSTLF